MIVIGGGDTGTDCVGTSLRHGCKSVTQFEILPQPPLERQADNPWPEWPKVLRVDYGQEEALARFGADPRSYCITAKKFIGDAEGRLAAVETVQIEWVAGANGSGLRPQEIPGTAKVWPAQLVLLAMGFLGPEETVLGDLGVERDQTFQCPGRLREIRHQRAGRLCGRRHAPRAEPGGLGHQRRPRRGARDRSIFDGRDALGVKPEGCPRHHIQGECLPAQARTGADRALVPPGIPVADRSSRCSRKALPR